MIIIGLTPATIHQLAGVQAPGSFYTVNASTVVAVAADAVAMHDSSDADGPDFTLMTGRINCTSDTCASAVHVMFAV